MKLEPRRIFKKGKKHLFWCDSWEVVYRNKNGRILWREIIGNSLADEGEELAGDVFLRGSALTTFFLGLCDDTPGETTTLASLSEEPSGNGYARKEIERSATGWPTKVLDAGDWKYTSKIVTFVADGGSIGPVKTMFLTNVETSTSGKFIAWAALSMSRTIADGDSLSVTMWIKWK